MSKNVYFSLAFLWRKNKIKPDFIPHLSHNDESYKTLWNWWDYTLPINQNEKLEVWINNLKIQAINSSGEKKEKMLQIEVMKE